jgi:hypothetical protein
MYSQGIPICCIQDRDRRPGPVDLWALTSIPIRYMVYVSDRILSHFSFTARTAARARHTGRSRFAVLSLRPYSTAGIRGYVACLEYIDEMLHGTSSTSSSSALPASSA